jgi:hypothetical protein
MHRMLSAHCPRHGRNVLLTAAQIHGVESSERGHLVRWTCTCGTRGTTSIPAPRTPI